MTETIDWAVSEHPISYPDAVRAMEQRVAAIAAGKACELVWLLEHPPLYTAGTSAKASDLLAPRSLPVFKSGRGGQYTYHGPGQRVAYVMLDLGRRQPDVRLFVKHLQDWIVASLAELGVAAGPRDGRVGIWIERPGGPVGVDDKLAAIGIRLRKWVSFHGVSLNVDPDLSHYGGIVPCGISDHGVTSLAALGVSTTLSAVDERLRTNFETIFGPTIDAEAPKLNDAAQSPPPSVSAKRLS